MKRQLLLLLLMVVSGAALIVFVAEYKPPGEERKPVRRWREPGPEKSIEEIVARVGPTVVAITTRERRWLRGQFDDAFLQFFLGDPNLLAEWQRIGAGVIVDPSGYVITNEHVVGGATDIQVSLADGRQVEGVVCARDHDSDLAMLELAVGALPAAELGDSGDLMVGQWVLAFGNPFGISSEGSQPSVSVGVISALHRNLKVEGGRLYKNLIQTDAPINIGNDGGPLVDLSGRVIGMSTLIITSSGASTGVGFAIPADTMRERSEKLRSECKTGRPGRRRQR